MTDDSPSAGAELRAGDRQAEPWAVRSGNPHGWVWIQDDRCARLRRALWCRRFHRWKQNDDGDWYRTRRYCSVCAVKGRAMPDTAAKRVNRDGTRFRWWLWRQVIKLPSVCNANAHSRIIGRYRDQSLEVDDVCRSDLARNGTCWCGKLGTPASSPPTSGEGK